MDAARERRLAELLRQPLLFATAPAWSPPGRTAAVHSLDPPILSVEAASSTLVEIAWLAAGLEDDRNRWLRFLHDRPGEMAIRDRLKHCGSHAWVFQDPVTGRYVVRSNGCNLRICPRCRRRLQHKISARIAELLTPCRKSEWQMITLTLKHNDEKLQDQLDRLRASFRKLRQRKLWKASVSYGYGILEINRNKTSSQWHPHLHVLARTDFIDWSQLRKDWLAVTGDSNIIDCQHVTSSRIAAIYVAKYVGKMPMPAIHDDWDLLADWYFALRAGKMLIRFGKHPPRQRELPIDPAPELIALGRLATLIFNAAHGHAAAQRHLSALTAQRDEANRRQAQTKSDSPDVVSDDHDPPPF